MLCHRRHLRSIHRLQARCQRVRSRPSGEAPCRDWRQGGPRHTHAHARARGQASLAAAFPSPRVPLLGRDGFRRDACPVGAWGGGHCRQATRWDLSLIHISEPTRRS
eukprot:412281-Prymnesium_polylepis.1